MEDLQLQYDPANPGHREIQVDVCSQGGAGRVGGPIATCTLPLNLGSGRQEINKPLRAQVTESDCPMGEVQRGMCYHAQQLPSGFAYWPLGLCSAEGILMLGSAWDCVSLSPAEV